MIKKAQMAAMVGMLLTSCSISPKDLPQKKDALDANAIKTSPLAIRNESSNVCTEPSNSKVVGADDLIADYLSNPISFDANYKGKCIAVWGTVSDMKTTTGYEVILAPAEVDRIIDNKDGTFRRQTRRVKLPGNSPSVIIQLPEDSVSSISDIKVGSSNRAFIGKITGIVDNMYISFSDAKIYKGAPEKILSCYESLMNLSDVMRRFGYVMNITSEYFDGATNECKSAARFKESS